MIQHPSITEERMNGELYHFMEYKKKKPFFKKPMKITVGTPINDSYYMVRNVVYKGKQILALKKEQDSNPNKIVLVEAKIEDGQLIYISRLPDECLVDIKRMFTDTVYAF